MMVRERLDPEMRKEDIQKAAMALFSSKGFNNTTMDDVREKSGLSAGGLYYYYKNTAEILYDIMDRGSRMREATVTNT
ncbi:MAG: helix-turn-helix domain-containing protein, partial [Atopobium minutum]|nr:helix-turn-helix domain-containing protein [Atopobium minutum]